MDSSTQLLTKDEPNQTYIWSPEWGLQTGLRTIYPTYIGQLKAQVQSGTHQLMDSSTQLLIKDELSIIQLAGLGYSYS